MKYRWFISDVGMEHEWVRRSIVEHYRCMASYRIPRDRQFVRFERLHDWLEGEDVVALEITEKGARNVVQASLSTE